MKVTELVIKSIKGPPTAVDPVSVSKKQLQQKKEPQICFELPAVGLFGESARRQYGLHQMAHQFRLQWSVGG